MKGVSIQCGHVFFSKINRLQTCIERYPMDIIFDVVMCLDKIYNMNSSHR